MSMINLFLEAAHLAETSDQKETSVPEREDFICPCCHVTYAELLEEDGHNKDGSKKNLIHNHHDHIEDGLGSLTSFGANPEIISQVGNILRGFYPTDVCHRCNAAENSILKNHLIGHVRPELRKLASFSPEAIRKGVLRIPGGNHVMSPYLLENLEDHAQDVIKRSSVAGALINGIRNATIGADLHEIGEIIDAVFEAFLKDGMPPDIRNERLGPLDWYALSSELQWIENRRAPICDLTREPVRGNHFLHDFHTGETISGFAFTLPEDVRDRFVQIMSIGQWGYRGTGDVVVRNGNHVTQFHEEAKGAYSCAYCTPGAETPHRFFCAFCASDAELVRRLLCVSERDLLSPHELLLCVDWDDTMKIRVIDMDLAVQLYRSRTDDDRRSIVQDIRNCFEKKPGNALHEIIVKVARKSASLPDFLERLVDQSVTPRVQITSSMDRIEWFQFWYSGQKFTGSEVHFGVGEMAAYGIRFDPVADIDHVLPFRFRAKEWEKA